MGEIYFIYYDLSNIHKLLCGIEESGTEFEKFIGKKIKENRLEITPSEISDSEGNHLSNETCEHLSKSLKNVCDKLTQEL